MNPGRISPDPTAGTSGLIPGAAVLWKREMLHFLRQRARLVGFIGSPVIFWIVIGSGFNRSFSYTGARPDISYLEFYFPGTIVLTMLFTAIFASISIIEDRHSGFLQGVLVAPVPRLSISSGKILGAASLALMQALLLLLLVPVLGIGLSPASVVLSVLSLVILAVGLAGLGFLIAWRMDTTQGFHAVMNLLLIPLWLLSGSLFPVHGAASWIEKIMLCNPLYYGMSTFRQALYLASVPEPQEVLPLPLNFAIISIFSVVMLFLSARSAKTRKT
ncbi:MAG TPA: ABC transporter permease [Bacteroidota bacterium]|nr:ABC transporter permease [Bacteroidota bacterium]